jgi:DNA-binding NtrC family response regulator
VRELRNVVQRAVMLSGGGPVHEAHVILDPRASSGSQGAVPMESIDTVVAGHVHRVVEALGGTRIRAAEILGCDPKTLRKYLRLYSQILERKGEPLT